MSVWQGVRIPDASASRRDHRTPAVTVGLTSDSDEIRVWNLADLRY
jgi:hypothetical protein